LSLTAHHEMTASVDVCCHYWFLSYIWSSCFAQYICS
jgi:hypothetical protein